MKVVLEIEGKEKTFVAPKVKGRMFRTALTLSKELREVQNQGELDADVLDELVQFVCDVYGNRFDLDEFWDGIDNDLLMPTIYETIEFVANTLNDLEAKKKLPSKKK